MNVQETNKLAENVVLFKTGHGYSYWVEILSNDATVPYDGLYLFVSIDDNHYEYALSACSSGEKILSSVIRAYRGHEPDFVLAFHPIAMYSAEDKSWTDYKSGDRAKVSGIYVWLISKNGEEKYVYRRYRRGEDMLSTDNILYYNGEHETFQEWEFRAYHGCFEYTDTQLYHHNELLEKYAHK